VLLLGAHQARALLAAPEAPGDGGAAARRMAALVVRVHQQVQVRQGGLRSRNAGVDA
jgi:hypothetical protein